MAPVSGRSLASTNHTRYEDARDYRSHIRFNERSRRDTHQESKRKRRSNSQSNEDGRQRRRVNYESRNSSSNPIQSMRHRRSERVPSNEERKISEQDSRKRALSKYQNHALMVKETIAKSFGLSKSKLSKILNDKCDQLIRNNILSETKLETQHFNAVNEIEPSSSLRNHTDEVHMQDQNLSLDDERFDEAPNNDYSQHFVNTGLRPQNFIRDAGLHDRFEEYPKLRELIRLKDEYIQKSNTAPMYLNCDLLANNFTLASLKCEFDVILIEPPLEEYKKTNGVHFDRYVNWDEVIKLDVENVAAQRSFVFLWCGSEEGLDQGRSCLKKWGFRRCEDICWVKTNRCNPRHPATLDTNFIFQRTKEHCLMGIRGTVRRSVDSDFIHANVDIDLIITEEPNWGDPNKPIELFHIIEHFCLGRRRLHLFARDSTIRRGWLSIGSEISTSNFDKQIYESRFEATLPSMENLTERIEQLRPKSPPPKGLKLAPTSSTNSVSATINNTTSNPASSSLNMPNNSNSNTGTSSTARDSSASNILQEGQQAIRSTITSNRQSSTRSTRPHWTLYPDELSNNNYPNMISSPNRHQYSSSYGDLHLLPDFDLGINGANGSSQADYENYFSQTGEPSEERNNFRS